MIETQLLGRRNCCYLGPNHKRRKFQIPKIYFVNVNIWIISTQFVPVHRRCTDPLFWS